MATTEERRQRVLGSGRVQRAIARMAAEEGMSVFDFLTYLTNNGISAPMLAAKIGCTHQAVSQIYKAEGAKPFSVRVSLDGKIEELGFKDLEAYLVARHGKATARQQAEELGISMSTLKRRRAKILGK